MKNSDQFVIPHTSFPPLPDPVGFAGTFTAVLNHRLVTGGGSQISEKPLWLGGKKAFSDRMFALDGPEGAWVELKTRLPFKMAHFAFAASAETVYLAGGLTEEGPIKEVFAIRAGGDEVTIHPLPKLSRPLAFGAGAIANDRLYVAGGQPDITVKAATPECWSLDLHSDSDTDGWRREPDLPGTGTFVASMASDGENLFFIGGVSFNPEGTGVQSRQVFRLAPDGLEWEPLPDLPEPRVGPVHPSPILVGNQIFVMGGYARAYPGEPRDHPGFSRQTFLYDIAGQTWRLGPLLPHNRPTDRDTPSDPGPAPMVAASGAVWRNYFVAVSGEVRASVRTPAVVAYPLSVL